MDSKTVIDLRELLVQDAQNRQKELDGVFKVLALLNERVWLLESQVVQLSTELSTAEGARKGKSEQK